MATLTATAGRLPDDTRKLRVLVVSPFFPIPPTSGFSVRVYHLARTLAARHDVTLLSYVTPRDEHVLDDLDEPFAVVAVRHRHKLGLARRLSQIHALFSRRPFAAHMVRSVEMQDAVDRLCAERQFDVIQVESCSMSQFSFPVGTPVVLDEHNIEYELRKRLVTGERSLLRRLYNQLEYLRFRAYEQHCWQGSQACVLTSEREVPEVERIAPRTITEAVHNGVDLDSFTPAGADEDPELIVFNAIFSYRPNADAAMFLVDEIWPLVLARRPTARLQLVGTIESGDRQRLSRPGVEILGRVDRVQPYLAQAAVIAVPVRMGGGTRLKVVEGLATAKAMVSTTIGCEGVAVRDGEHLLIADDPEAFAARIVELLADSGERLRLGRAGRRLMEERYSWEMAGLRLERLFNQLLEQE